MKHERNNSTKDISLRQIFIEARGVKDSDYLHSNYVTDMKNLKRILSGLYLYADDEESIRQNNIVTSKSNTKLSLKTVKKISPFSKCVLLTLMRYNDELEDFKGKLRKNEFDTITTDEIILYSSLVLNELQKLELSEICNHIDIFPYKTIRIKIKDINLEDEGLDERIREVVEDLINDGFDDEDDLEIDIQLNKEEMEERYRIEWNELLDDIYGDICEDIRIHNDCLEYLELIKSQISQKVDNLFLFSKRNGIIYPTLSQAKDANYYLANMFEGVINNRGINNPWLSDFDYEEKMDLLDLLENKIKLALEEWENEATEYIKSHNN